MAQAAPLASPWGLAQSWERGREKNRVRHKKERSKNVSCAPLRGLEGLFIPQIWRVCRAADAVDARRGQERLADPSAVRGNHAQGPAGGFGHLGLPLCAAGLDFLFD